MSNLPTVIRAPSWCIPRTPSLQINKMKFFKLRACNNHRLCHDKKPAFPAGPFAAWQLRLPPSSDQGLVHDPGDPAANQADPRDNDLFLFKGGAIQSLIGHESQRSQ